MFGFTGEDKNRKIGNINDRSIFDVKQITELINRACVDLKGIFPLQILVENKLRRIWPMTNL